MDFTAMLLMMHFRIFLNTCRKSLFFERTRHARYEETVCILGNTNRKPDDVIKVTVDVDKMHEILDKEKAEREMKESSE